MEGVIGYTTLFGGNFAPREWAFCLGQTLSISQNTALFSILGNAYGGNGTTTFQLPNLAGRQVVGAGQGQGLSDYAIGQTGGVDSVMLTRDQMPAHTHPIAVSASPRSLDDTGNVASPDSALFAGNGTGYAASANIQMAPYTASVQMAPVGGGIPYSIMPAYLGLNYIICTYGVYPPRG